MRATILMLGLAVAGCASDQVYRPPANLPVTYPANAVPSNYNQSRIPTDEQVRAIQGDLPARAARDTHAESVCRYRGRTVENTYVTRSLVRLDAQMAGAQAYQDCLQVYRDTGIVPAP